VQILRSFWKPYSITLWGNPPEPILGEHGELAKYQFRGSKGGDPRIDI
jgi:hypothetical protein